MALWGATTADESKPKFLTDAEKKLVYANASGWVLEAGANSAEYTGNNNPDAQPEVLVAIGKLATGLGAADITDVYFKAKSYAAGATGRVVVIFNEKVSVTNGATLTVRNTTDSADITATAAAQTGVNRAEFTFTAAAQGKVHALQAQTITGTIVDTIGGGASDKQFVAGDVKGAGGSGTTKTFTAT